MFSSLNLQQNIPQNLRLLVNIDKLDETILIRTLFFYILFYYKDNITDST